MPLGYRDLSKMIDHSLLSPTLTWPELEAGCRMAVAYDVASVCILPYALKRCVELLSGSDVQPSTTIGFPHGGQATRIKIAEAELAVAEGCGELDMVVNISQVLSGNWQPVREEIAAILDVAHARQRFVKVIFENCSLNTEQKIRLCEICGELGADWVKTSTGYGSGGATLDDVTLMRKHSPATVQVKAAGGIKDVETILAMRAAGATRIGSSRTRALLDDWCRQLGLPLRASEEVAENASGY